MTFLREKLTFPQVAKSVFLLFVMLVINGCAAQTVKVGNLDALKGKTFKLGVVKAAGSPPSALPFADTRIFFKNKALQRVPIDDVSSTLAERFAIAIDTSVDKGPHVVEEGAEGTSAPLPKPGVSVNLKPAIENAYYGTLEYGDSNRFWMMMGGSAKIKNEEDFPDVMNLTYSMEQASLGFETRFLYFIKVKSSGQDVLEINGVVATIRTPTHGGIIFNEEGIWDEYVKHAGDINDALKRDLAAVAQR